MHDTYPQLLTGILGDLGHVTLQLFQLPRLVLVFEEQARHVVLTLHVVGLPLEVFLQRLSRKREKVQPTRSEKGEKLPRVERS